MRTISIQRWLVDEDNGSGQLRVDFKVDGIVPEESADLSERVRLFVDTLVAEYDEAREEERE